VGDPSHPSSAMPEIIDIDAINIKHKHIIFFTPSYTLPLDVRKKQANVTK
jgi:hypothetical protein